MTTITVNEIIAALQDAAKPNDDGYATCAEIGGAMGCSAPTARQRLKLLQDAGRLSMRRVQRTALDGRIMQIAAYKVTRKK